MKKSFSRFLMILLAFCLVAANMFAVPQLAKAELAPGDDIFSSVGTYQVVTISGGTPASPSPLPGGTPFSPMSAVNLSPGATVVAAYIGYMVESLPSDLQGGGAYPSACVDQFAVTYDSSVVATIPVDRTSDIPSPYQSEGYSDGIMQYSDVTALVQEHGNGVYGLGGGWAGWTYCFMVLVVSDPTCPLTSVVINDTFWSNTDNNAEATTVTLPIASGYVVAPGAHLQVRSFATSFDYDSVTMGPDLNRMTYDLLDNNASVVATGTLINPATGDPDKYMTANNWNDVPLTLPAQASEIRLNYSFEGNPPPLAGTGSMSEVAGLFVTSVEIVIAYNVTTEYVDQNDDPVSGLTPSTIVAPIGESYEITPPATALNCPGVTAAVGDVLTYDGQSWYRYEGLSPHSPDQMTGSATSDKRVVLLYTAEPDLLTLRVNYVWPDKTTTTTYAPLARGASYETTAPPDETVASVLYGWEATGDPASGVMDAAKTVTYTAVPASPAAVRIPYTITYVADNGGAESTLPVVPGTATFGQEVAGTDVTPDLATVIANCPLGFSLKATPTGPFVVSDGASSNDFEVRYVNTAPRIDLGREALYVQAGVTLTLNQIFTLADASISDAQESIPLSKLTVTGYDAIAWDTVNYPAGDGYLLTLAVKDSGGLAAPIRQLAIFVEQVSAPVGPPGAGPGYNPDGVPSGTEVGADAEGNLIIYVPRPAPCPTSSETTSTEASAPAAPAVLGRTVSAPVFGLPKTGDALPVLSLFASVLVYGALLLFSAAHRRRHPHR